MSRIGETRGVRSLRPVAQTGRSASVIASIVRIFPAYKKAYRDVLHSFHLPLRLNSLQHISHAGRRNADQTGNLGEGHPGLIYKLFYDPHP